LSNDIEINGQSKSKKIKLRYTPQSSNRETKNFVGIFANAKLSILIFAQLALEFASGERARARVRDR